MSHGLVHSTMSYYMRDEGFPGGPDIEPCGSMNLDGALGIGLYRTGFDMGSATGAAIIVFEVGDVKEDNAGTNAVERALADKLMWHYNGTWGSEYSAVHMGDTDDSGSNADTMHGIGYMRGMIGSELQGSKTAASGQSYTQPSLPLSTVTGSRLLASGESLTWNNTSGVSTTYNGATTPDTDDKFGGSAQLEITTNSPDSANEYEFLDKDQAAAASVSHGVFKDLIRYLWNSGIQDYDATMTGQFAGVYTGHDQEETADINGNSFVGSSAVTLTDNSLTYATRQAMMVVPVIGGGIVDVHIESPMHGTWHRHSCFCPIALPAWGGESGNNVGMIAGVGGNPNTPYASASDACNHNFTNPAIPISGSIKGVNVQKYHVNSQDRKYRQQGMATWSGTQRSGGHVIAGLDHTDGGSTEWKHVVNRFDWVFDDDGGVTRTAVGFYAMLIGGARYVVEVGDTNTAGVAQAGVVKDVTAC